MLAAATFASVRSANRAARVAERSLLESVRPLLMPSRLGDPPQKITFVDGKWMNVPGGRAAAEANDEAVYFAIPLRNVGAGIAVLHGWRFYPERVLGNGEQAPNLDEFTPLTRDLYVPAQDQAYWQGAFRHPESPEFQAAKASVEAHEALTVDVLYGDREGGQRMVSRFGLLPRDDGGWMAASSRHWNIDREDPR